MNLKVIAFDADDTLWVNEPYFRHTEEQFYNLLGEFSSQQGLERELFKIEIENLSFYGYGIKGFVLSMIETALKVTNNKISTDVIGKIIELGKEMMNQPIELLDGVEEVLEALKDKYRLVVATKGDLLDQERKLKKSGISHYFHHIEIMSEKDDANYRKLIKHLDIHPNELLMVGNSLKSDILPVLNVGGHGVHVPYHITWAHEHIEDTIDDEKFKSVEGIREILGFL
ncbi:HAD family hydrolase [Mucilaginibacter gotjawali]|uniref:DUMP phosphatase n=2 Tax=Mucilaginibacter gotjawali TaxID=1550579 RepID=A0A110B2Q4_9SPHI|nr:HAD family hydrolase [Mucilaginibacter gotjawali]MBB3053662.1 putative hydrolase of the HAD superfamily [Mucilaginibacter gotjawali]BAU53922.1 dUMP phosphatase [Mucilaginibacter gotjawali]